MRIAWDDGEQEPLPLVDLLSCGFQLERYADNRPAPHPKRRRNAAVAVIAGMSIANAWALYQYHVSASEYDTFLEFVHDVAYAAITNTYDADHPSSVPRGMNCAPFGTPSLTSSRLSTTSTSIGVSASQLEDSHVAVSIRLMAGWKGKTQQRCSECNAPTSYCCAGCSTHDCIVPIHPSEVSYRGVTKKFGCLARHKRHPDISRRTVRSVSRSIGKKRR